MASQKKTSQTSNTNDNTAPVSRKKKFHAVFFYHDWCKQCGLCIAFCPKQIIKADKVGKPYITDEDKCNGCRFCEMHCPDFSITVELKTPKRRKSDE